MSVESQTESRVRTATFDWLAKQVSLHGDVLPRELLAEGFYLDGERVPLLGPQGIFKPRLLGSIPLSITTTTKSPYSDAFTSDGLLRYSYRGADPQHRDNVGLRQAMLHRVPLIYFHSIVPGRYLVVCPVFIVADNPQALAFTVAVDDAQFASASMQEDFNELRDGAGSSARREYITRAVRQRMHQRSFREKVLRAYQNQCALCHLKHEELLDAAHIIPDGEPTGDPVVENGLSLCKLHHAAFDRLFIGIRPDYRIEVREDLMNESDGPMLKHGLQGMHNGLIMLPKKSVERPDPVRLGIHYEKFRKTG